MISVIILTVLLVAAAAANRSCSDADVTLVDYIKWQMKTTSISTTPSNKNCKCKEKRSFAFNARISKALTNLPANSVVVFGTLTMNEGGGYDKKTGIFTCQEDGIYAFSWTILTAAKSRFHSKLIVDGKEFCFNHNDNDRNENHKSSSQAVSVTLKTGNKVWISTLGNDGKYAHERYSSFSGFRV